MRCQIYLEDEAWFLNKGQMQGIHIKMEAQTLDPNELHSPSHRAEEAVRDLTLSNVSPVSHTAKTFCSSAAAEL